MIGVSKMKDDDKKQKDKRLFGQVVKELSIRFKNLELVSKVEIR